MSAADAIVKLQPLDRPWTTVGDRDGRLIYPQGLGFAFNDHGPDSAHFTLPRRTGLLYPDLSPWTPAEVWVGGACCWEGRIREAPEQQGGSDAVNVEGIGWQYHADDDTYWRRYVETDLSLFKDQRTMLTANLALYHAGGGVSTDADGCPVITWPAGTVVPAGGRVGVTLDLGPLQDAAWGSVTVTHSAAASQAGVTAYARVHTIESESAAAGAQLTDVFGNVTLTSAATPYNASGSIAALSSLRRYLTVFLFHATGATFTADTWLRVSAIRLASSASYASTLLASDIIKDALPYMPLLSQSQVRIATTAFGIPAYSPDGQRTPRGYIDDANAFHDYQWRVQEGRILQYRARPAAPIYTIGGWSDAAFAYASANSGQDIYSDAIAEGSGPDGARISVRRVNVPNQYRQDTAPGQGPINPSFLSATTGWTVTGGTITRSTGSFFSTPASGSIANTAGTAIPVTRTSLGTAFVPGQTYRLRVYLYVDTTKTTTLDVNILDSANTIIAQLAGAQATDAPSGNTQSVANAWGERHIVFTATDTTHQLELQPTATTPAGSNALILVDDTIIERSVPTVVNRRGFRRTKALSVGMPVTSTVLQQLADAYLAGHHATPFRGGLKIGNERDLRLLVGGASTSPELLGWQVGELVLFWHLIDPDTGAVGRAGRITGASYDHASRSTQLDIDNTRTSFDALLSRMGVLS